jgi:hypothetical protein
MQNTATTYASWMDYRQLDGSSMWAFRIYTNRSLSRMTHLRILKNSLKEMIFCFAALRAKFCAPLAAEFCSSLLPEEMLGARCLYKGSLNAIRLCS